jgi:hypothetical protein
MTRIALASVASAALFACTTAGTAASAGVVATDSYGGHTYAFVSDSKTFDDAQDACSAMHMDLVSINSAAEQAWLIERTFVSTPSNAYSGYLNTWIWTGAHNDSVDSSYDVYDAINDGDWEWYSGDAMTFTDFDGDFDYDAWNLDHYGAAVTLTDPWNDGDFGSGHEWRIRPASFYQAFFCESR